MGAPVNMLAALYLLSLQASQELSMVATPLLSPPVPSSPTEMAPEQNQLRLGRTSHSSPWA